MNISAIIGAIATLVGLAMLVRGLRRWVAGTERGVVGAYFLVLWTFLALFNATATLGALR